MLLLFATGKNEWPANTVLKLYRDLTLNSQPLQKITLKLPQICQPKINRLLNLPYILVAVYVCVCVLFFLNRNKPTLNVMYCTKQN